jgi:hypothetical protein
MPHMHVKVSVLLRRVGLQKLISNDDFWFSHKIAARF